MKTGIEILILFPVVPASIPAVVGASAQPVVGATSQPVVGA